MKRLLITTFATAFVFALALPALAQSICGSSGTEGMPSCSTVKAGTSCCVPPAAKVSSKTVKTSGKATVSMATHHQETLQAQQVLPAVKGPSNKPSVSVSAPAAPSAPAAMATGPTNGGTGTATGTGLVSAQAAPAASAKGSIQRGASSSGGRGSVGAPTASSAARR